MWGGPPHDPPPPQSSIQMTSPPRGSFFSGPSASRSRFTSTGGPLAAAAGWGKGPRCLGWGVQTPTPPGTHASEAPPLPGMQAP